MNTPEETALFELGNGESVRKYQSVVFPNSEANKFVYIANKKARSLQSQISVLKIPPSDTERMIIHDIFLKTMDPKLVVAKLKFIFESFVLEVISSLLKILLL